MADIVLSITRGDSTVLPFQAVDANGSPIDLTGAVIKFSVKKGLEDPNAAAIVEKTSYAPGDVDVVDAANGLFTVSLYKHDTVTAKLSTYQWDVELTRPGAANTPASVGTAATTPGSATIVGTGTAFKKLNVGDLVRVGSKPVTVVAVADDAHFDTDFTDWSAASGLSFTAFFGDVKTVAIGTIQILKDVTR